MVDPSISPLQEGNPNGSVVSLADKTADADDNISRDDAPLGWVDLTITDADDASKSHRFRLETALTPAQQTYGLMFRKSLDADGGMIFFMPYPVIQSIWMKNTYIPLDVVFVREDGTIAHIHPNAKPHDLTPIRSPEPVVAIVELKGGITSELDINTGDKIAVPPYLP